MNSDNDNDDHQKLIVGEIALSEGRCKQDAHSRGGSEGGAKDACYFGEWVRAGRAVGQSGLICGTNFVRRA